jgi:phosphosulfolactate phosphohydrolase-like enzyme
MAVPSGWWPPGPGAGGRWSDAARAAVLAFRAAAPELPAVLADATHARRLAAQGFDRDVAWCAALDSLDFVAARGPDGWLRRTADLPLS